MKYNEYDIGIRCNPKLLTGARRETSRNPHKLGSAFREQHPSPLTAHRPVLV